MGRFPLERGLGPGPKRGAKKGRQPRRSAAAFKPLFPDIFTLAARVTDA